MKTQIVSAGNVEPPIYQLLNEKGYFVRIENNLWIAENETSKFIGENIIELAGLIYLIDAKGKNWKVTDDIIEEYLKEFGQDG